MSCSVRDTNLPRGATVSVNGVVIAHDRIAQEIQHHPSGSVVKAWQAAARALVVRELLLQEAAKCELRATPEEDGDGRKETDEEALMRTLVESAITIPEPDEPSCRRYYEGNRRRFRSHDLYEAAHILIAAAEPDAMRYEAARGQAGRLIAELREHPDHFSALAKQYSACPSAAQGGNLGQLSEGQTTPEFERALIGLNPGTITQDPVATRYGFHVIYLARKIEGRELPFSAVSGRIADYLTENVRRRATAQYIARLVSAAKITGIELPDAKDLRVH